MRTLRPVLALLVAAVGLTVGARLVSGRPRHAPPGRREVFGFVVGWDPASVREMVAHRDELTHVILQGWTLAPAGDRLQGGPRRTLVQQARHTGLPVLAMVGNYDGAWDPVRVHRLCSSPSACAHFIAELQRVLLRDGYQGVNIDFEELMPGDRVALVAALTRLRAALAPHGLWLTIDAPVGRALRGASAYDLRGLSRVCDRVLAMVYDEHGAEGGSGPIASHDWANHQIAAALRQVPARRLVVGVGTYGYDWGGVTAATDASFSRALSLAKSHGLPILWDSTAGAPHFRYQERGQAHTVWFEDAASVSGRLAAALRGGCGGVSLWHLGEEDPALWRELKGFRRGRLPADLLDPTVAAATIVQTVGRGDFMRIYAGVPGGTRHFERHDGEIVAERYPPLPSAFRVQRCGPAGRHEIALTFDDGPDPASTRPILNILRREHVPATFFVIGDHARQHPELLRRIVADGHCLGNHTFTHPDLRGLPPLRLRVELNLTQRVIESITGRRTLLFRAPYLPDPYAGRAEELTPIIQVGEAGYLAVGASIDPRDWEVRQADTIVHRCLRQADGDGILLLHDAGGDRRATVAALPQLIAAYHARGYRFVSLPDLLGVPRDEVMPPTQRRPVVAALLQTGLACQDGWTRACAVVTLVGLLMVVLRGLATTSLALLQYRRSQRARPHRSDDLPTVSALVPAYNEAAVIGRTLAALLASNYPSLEILVIDDGSTDGTAEVAEQFATDPRLRVLRLPNGGKGRALNAGIAASRGEIVIAIDADTLFEPETVRRLVAPFADASVGAVAGNIKVGNRRSLLTQWQSIEYIVGINLDKRFFDYINCITVVPGAVGAWRKEALERVDGFSGATLAEDADLTFAVQRAGYRVLYEGRAVAWTEAPSTLRCLAKQRLRWTFGTFQCLWKHRAAFLRRSGGTLGLVAMPYLLLYHALLLAGPLVDLSALGWMLAGRWEMLAQLAAPFLLAELFFAGVAFSFDRESKWPLLLVPLQRVVYRQLLYLTALQSLLCVLRGTHVRWRKARRTGAARLESVPVEVA
jgi:cellulose synthase/poly-beta-1,6-N-acetylglucosamine synthase-like glycosyltransferase/peptidoglycan/xylan/chitin deacetylase (PgdA/CDA1 family)